MDPIKKVASFLSSQLRRTDASERSRQLPYSSVTLDSGEDAPVAEGIMRGVDAMDNVTTLDEHLAAASDISDNAAIAQTLLPGRLDIAARAGEEALIAVAATAERVVAVQSEAAAAADLAANALTTANGKNARRRGKAEPVAPEGGWAQGDQWVVENDEGDPIEVRVWNGTAWVPDQILADELLIVGDDGVVRLKDGVVTASSLAVDAVDGKTITGALIRTSEAGQRIELDANSLRTYSSSGSISATLSPTANGLTLVGKELSGGATTSSVQIDPTTPLVGRAGVKITGSRLESALKQGGRAELTVAGYAGAGATQLVLSDGIGRFYIINEQHGDVPKASRTRIGSSDTHSIEFEQSVVFKKPVNFIGEVTAGGFYLTNGTNTGQLVASPTGTTLSSATGIVLSTTVGLNSNRPLKKLWEGAWYMQAGQEAVLSETVSQQVNGLILCWSRYASGVAGNDSFSYTVVPKSHNANFNGQGIYHVSTVGFDTAGDYKKYVYVNNEKVIGNANNATAPNTRAVLRVVYGF